jgi:DNA polymerase-3 subunit gamma/tau
VRADPLVQAVLARFPGAEIVDVRRRAVEAAPVPLPGDEPEEEASDLVADESSAFGSQRGGEDQGF